MTDTRKQKTISAVETSFEILQILSEIEPAGVSEITEEIQMSTSTVFSHVNTLVQEGYVIKTGTKYTRSLRFLEAVGLIRRHELYILSDGNQTMLNELPTNTGFDEISPKL
jgi:DNA-binding IclR family transcriptional regulator